jgi:hypothetical protein
MRAIKITFLICLVAATFSVNAQQPDKTPCPTIKIDGPSTEGHGIGAPLVFSAAINEVFPATDSSESDTKQSFSWSVSAGKILSGQGESAIVVGTEGLIFHCLTVTVELKGLEKDCAPKATWRATIGTCCIHFRQKFDEYVDMPFKDEKARLDNIALRLKAESGALVRIVGHNGRNRPKGTAARRIQRAKNYLIKKQGIDPNRIVIGPKNPEYEPPLETFTMQYWIEPIKGLVTQPCT